MYTKLDGKTLEDFLKFLRWWDRGVGLLGYLDAGLSESLDGVRHAVLQSVLHRRRP